MSHCYVNTERVYILEYRLYAQMIKLRFDFEQTEAKYDTRPNFLIPMKHGSNQIKSFIPP